MEKPVCFVVGKRPISYNSSKKAKYQTELQNAFKRFKGLYPDLPLDAFLDILNLLIYYEL